MAPKKREFTPERGNVDTYASANGLQNLCFAYGCSHEN